MQELVQGTSLTAIRDPSFRCVRTRTAYLELGHVHQGILVPSPVEADKGAKAMAAHNASLVYGIELGRVEQLFGNRLLSDGPEHGSERQTDRCMLTS